VQVVSQVDTDKAASGRGIYRHIVGGVIKEFGPAVPLNVVRVIVTPSQLHIYPILCRRCAIEIIFLLM
jgi:hypothetical protein